MEWIPVATLEELTQRGRLIKRFGDKQLAIFSADGERFFACNNRCPH